MTTTPVIEPALGAIIIVDNSYMIYTTEGWVELDSKVKNVSLKKKKLEDFYDEEV